MARVNVQVFMLVALAAVVVHSFPVMAGSGHRGPPIHRHHDTSSFFNPKGWNGVLCIPDVVPLLDVHEGRHECAYDHENGYRAVGAGYNLDDNVPQRRKEISELHADYDEVYSRRSCLNNLQITGLLVLDAKRALDRAADNVKGLDDFCCSVQAVFADIQHSAGPADNFPQSDLETFIEKASREEYKPAAHELGKTKWCSRQENKRRCDDNVGLVAQGCSDTSSVDHLSRLLYASE